VTLKLLQDHYAKENSVKLSFVTLVFASLLGHTVLADDTKGPQVMDGHQANIVGMRVETHPETNLSDLIATVSYNTICSPTAALIVVPQGNNKYVIIDARVRFEGAACQAISYANQEIKVGTFNGPVPTGLSINGQALRQ
jgi:hypothetical protein